MWYIVLDFYRRELNISVFVEESINTSDKLYSKQTMTTYLTNVLIFSRKVQENRKRNKNHQTKDQKDDENGISVCRAVPKIMMKSTCLLFLTYKK